MATTKSTYPQRLSLAVLATFVTLAGIVIPASAQTGARPVKTICAAPIAQDIGMSLHAVFAVKFYAPALSDIEWRWRYLTRFEGSEGPTAKNFVRTWVLNGTGCDALIGPGYSFIASAMSPLVDALWIDASATSTELSDKKNHPTFSRVIPTDEVGARGAALVYAQFGWTSTNIMCSEEPYGRSVAAGLTAALANMSGTVDVRSCFESTADEPRVRAALEAMMASKTRIVFVGGLPFHDWFTSFKRVVLETRAYEKLVFFFSEAFCSSGDRTYAEIPGSMCATYLADETIIAPFWNAYDTADRTDERAALAQLGYPEASTNLFAKDIYAVLAHDATLLAMRAMRQYHIETSVNGRTPAELGDIIFYTRRFSSEGATGTVRLEANGDRTAVNLVVYNVFDANMTQRVVGNVRDGIFSYNNPASPGAQPLMNFLGRQTMQIPAAFEPPAAVDESKNTGTIVGVIVAVVVVLVVGAIVFVKLTAPKTRDNSAAPKSSSEPFAVVFTDIQSSTGLWAREPEIMSDAVEMHHTLIRKLIAKHKGYEVKTVGDSFMIAFKRSQDAVMLALEIQTVFFEHEWFDGQLDNVYRDLLMEAGVTLPPNYTGLWNGLRVRVGVNFGMGNVQFDEVTLGYDYYGTVVNTAARVESVGHGGQVLVTAAAYEGLKLPPGATAVDLGPQPLRGLDDAVRLYQINAPGPLSQRTFPPLRLDVEPDLDTAASPDQSNSESKSMQSGGSVVSVRSLLAARAGKYVKVTGAAATAATDELLFFHAYTKMLLSTSKEDYRQKVVAHLGQKWRVADVTEKSVKTTRGYENGLMDVVAKALAATQTQQGTNRATRVEVMENSVMLMSARDESLPSFVRSTNQGAAVLEHSTVRD